ncbi:unnamed protein product [Trifolium pratense]|uniref:Uncharacterized protein n=1 Tax=Trifolium pratense TaxID=57577 RepID=A0ACB0ID93_TRIPR|nr:unnamed protein product [Trifolium pratense]
MARESPIQSGDETPNVAGAVATIAWCIWNNRNNWVWNGLKDTAKSIAMRAVHMTQEWQAVNDVQQQQTRIISAPVHALQRWQQPRIGWWKCNVDASFFNTSGHTGWSWCIRDSNDNFVAAGTNINKYHLSILEGEAMAILEAIREASTRGWSNIIFESDSKIVVDAIQASHRGTKSHHTGGRY